MELFIRPLFEEEEKYTFKQSSQISGQTGLICSFNGSLNNELSGEWKRFRKELKTEEFNKELMEIMKNLRYNNEYNKPLNSLSSLKRNCSRHKKWSFKNDEYYGIRITTLKYAYLFRFSLVQEENNVVCYCYVKDWLDTHITNARKGIRFIDVHYNNLFHLPDAGKIVVKSENKEETTFICRYIDGYHLEINHNVYHICEFAEKMRDGNYQVSPDSSPS